MLLQRTGGIRRAPGPVQERDVQLLDLLAQRGLLVSCQQGVNQLRGIVALSLPVGAVGQQVSGLGGPFRVGKRRAQPRVIARGAREVFRHEGVVSEPDDGCPGTRLSRPQKISENLPCPHIVLA